MIPIGQIAQPDAGLKILTPWWDVLTRYLTAAMVTIALTATALQAAKDSLICIPAVDCSDFLTNPLTVWNKTLPDNYLLRTVCNQGKPALNTSRTIIMTTMSDRRQYDFVDSLCFQTILQWFTAFFPFVIFGEAVLFLMIDNFWSKMPRTASALNQFVELAMECFNSEGTLSDILAEISKREQLEISQRERSEASGEESTPKVSDDKPSDTEPLVSKSEKVKSSQNGKQESKKKAKWTESSVTSVMKIKALYEKVDEFKNRYRLRHLLLRVYVIRVVLQILACSIFLGVNISSCSSLKDTHDCHLKEVFITKYEYFLCSRFIAPIYRAIVVIFAIPCVMCLCTSLYACGWIIYRIKFRKTKVETENSKESVRLVMTKPEAENAQENNKIEGDLSLLVSLLKEYDKIYYLRFSAFLSEKKKMKVEKNLENIYKTRGP